MAKEGWSVYHAPAANNAATISKAAVTNGTHVCTGFMATLSTGASAPTAIQVSVALRDGATGAGTILWTGVIAVPATAGVSAHPIVVTGVELKGTQNTAMTFEFSATAGANTIESVSMCGYTVKV